MILKNDSTKIGIARLLTLIGVEENYKEIAELNGYDHEYCSKVGCDVCRLIVGQVLDNEQEEFLTTNTCSRNCPYVDKKRDVYHNEKNEYKIKNVLMLSKSKLQQFLYYHTICNSIGGVTNLSIKQIAKNLGYTERTIKDNNKYFIDNQLICSSRLDADRFSFFIIGYRDYFKTKKEYGHGYLVLSKEVLIRLLEATNIVDIRFTLRKLIEYNKQNKFYDYSYTYVKHTYKELRRVLPSYINCPKKINDFIHNSKINIFITKFNDNGIEYRLKDKFNSHMIKDVRDREYEIAITHYLLKQGRSFGWKFIGEPVNDIFAVTDLRNSMGDFVQMARQYDLNLLYNGLDYLLMVLFKDGLESDYGAVVRNKIKDIIYGQATGG